MKAWSKEHRKKFSATMATRRAEKLVKKEEKQPDMIYVLVNGTLKAFVLRNMPVYIPREDLRPL